MVLMGLRMRPAVTIVAIGSGNADEIVAAGVDCLGY